MAAPINTSEISGLDSLEHQVAYLLVKLEVAENQYNAANPNSVVERITISPNYDNNTFSYSGSFAMSATAASGTIVAGVLNYLP